MTTALSAASFYGAAFFLWRKKPAPPAAPPESPQPPPARRGALSAFAALALAEWGDVGQLAAAALVARHGAPGAVWIGATLALWTKAALAVTLGLGLRRWVPQSSLRIAGVATCALLGTLALLRVD